MGRCNFILAFIWCSSLSAQIATAQSCPTVPAPGTCGCDFDLIFENGYQPPAAASALPPNSTPLALNDPFGVLSNSYSNIGLAQATAVVTLLDPMNVTSTVNVSRWVLSESLPITRLTLCKVFNDMKLRLAANSIPQALLTVNEDYRPRMQTLWTGLGAGLPNAANNLGFVLDGDLSSYQAQLRVARPQTIPTNWSVFPMLLTRDGDGVWRIRSM